MPTLRNFDPETPPPASRDVLLATMLDLFAEEIAALPHPVPRNTRLVAWWAGDAIHDSVILRGRWRIARVKASGALRLMLLGADGTLDLTNEPGPWWALITPAWGQRTMVAFRRAVAEAPSREAAEIAEKEAQRVSRIAAERERISSQEGD